MERAVAAYIAVLQGITEDVEEAMMNLVAWYEAGSWVVLLFRKAPPVILLSRKAKNGC